MPVDISKFLEKAKEAVERRNYDYAIVTYLDCLKMDPDHGQARKELRAVEVRMAKEKPPGIMAKAKIMGVMSMAHTMLTAKKYDSAIEHCENALRIDPNHTGAQLTLGRAVMTAGYKNAAVAVYEHMRESRAGGDTKALIEGLRGLGWAYEATSKFKEAMGAWEEVGKLTGGDHEATQHIRDLSAHNMSNKIETATKDAKAGQHGRSIIKDSKAVDQLARAERDIRTEEDLQLVLEDIKKDITARPDDPKLYAKLGDTWRIGNNYAEAKKAYQKAIEIDSNNPQWRIIKMDDLEIWRMTGEANELAKKAPTDPVAKENWSKKKAELLEYKVKSYLEREKQYTTDSKIKYELGSASFELGTAKNDNALLDQAITRFQFTFKDPKYRTESGMKMGQAFSKKGQYDLALKRFEETLSTLEIKDDRWKNLVYWRSHSLELSGKKAQALKSFLELYEVQIDFKDVSKRVQKLQDEGVIPTE